ncbi:MAG: FAD:protein FMN transferase [Flavobacteriales bacterium]
MRLFLLVIFVFIFLFSSCSNSRDEKEYIDLNYFEARGEGQGSTYSIIYFDSLQRNIKPAVDSILEIIDKSMSTYHNDSYISAINNGEMGLYPIDIHFYNVFKLSDSVFRITNGLFDPTIKPLVNFWKVGEKGTSIDAVSLLELDSVLAITGWGKNFFELISERNGPYKIKKKHPYASLDFNAIAQGYTVDVIAQYLESISVHDFFIELGGETFTKGKSPRGDCWRIGIEKPSQSDQKQVNAVVNACHLALATSGSYRKFSEVEGKKYSHAIHPHSGFPVEHNLLSVSVVTDNCAFADAIATAVLVMGTEKGITFLTNKRIEGYFIEAGSDGGFLITQTNGFEALLNK